MKTIPNAMQVIEKGHAFEKCNRMMSLDNDLFFRKVGITKKLFRKIVTILKIEDNERQKKGGRKRKLTIQEIVFMCFEYWRSYKVLFDIELEYGLSYQQVQRTIIWVENILVKHELFALAGKKKLLEDTKDTYLADVTEVSSERPKKNKK